MNLYLFFVFHDPATTKIYSLSLHDALPIYHEVHRVLDEEDRRAELAQAPDVLREPLELQRAHAGHPADRKSTRLNSSHSSISYAVFCLKKKKKTQRPPHASA